MEQRGHCKSRDYNYFYEKGNKIIIWERDFLYTAEQCQHLRELSLLAIGCHI